jgi:hypothetical protein
MTGGATSIRSDLRLACMRCLLMPGGLWSQRPLMPAVRDALVSDLSADGRLRDVARALLLADACDDQAALDDALAQLRLALWQALPDDMTGDEVDF